MGRLITVVGNSGVGKTALTRRLCELAPWVTGLEEHKERPFQRLFADRRQRFAFPNQIDYLLLRAEQEAFIRSSPKDGVQDGGLDLDFYVFTHYFYQKGYLDEAEFRLCKRAHALLRELMGPPDVAVYLQAPLEVIVKRFAVRGRDLEIADITDLEAMGGLLDEWLGREDSFPVIAVDASVHDPEYSDIGKQVIKRIYQQLG
jgi:deoxyadenosine/deoxycytidine kinase